MRKLIKNVITAEEANQLIQADNKYHALPVMKKIRTIIDKEVGPVNWNSETYTRLEKAGYHDWHVDTGKDNHMPWCEYGISILHINRRHQQLTFFSTDF